MSKNDRTMTRLSPEDKAGQEVKAFLKAGVKIKQYTIEKPLGKGAMGEVYQAHDTILDRKVAVKVISKRIEEDPTAKDRFLREAKSAAALDHAFICKIYEIGDFSGQPFIVMEYVEGTTLKDAFEEGNLSMKDSIKIILEAADALEKAHKKEIIHRDLKPSNIMLTPHGHVKVMDFGLAKKITDLDDDVEDTATEDYLSGVGSITGTPAFMSPEQTRGEFLDGRSDLFSLGIILYQLLSKQHPFMRGSTAKTMAAIQRDTPAPLALKPKSLMPKLNKVIQKSLAKDPNSRYANVSDMSRDLHQIHRDLSVGYIGRMPVWRLAAALVIISGLIAVAMWQLGLFTRVREAPPPRDPISLVVADFQNRTGDSAFDGGALEQTLHLGLEEGSFIKALDRADAAEMALNLDPESGGKVDMETAQLLSRSQGINVIIEGIIEEKGRGYEIRILARDSTTSDVVLEEKRTVSSKVDVMGASAKMAARIISRLGDVPLKSVKALSEETFTTSSLEAMNAYVEAQDLAETGNTTEAIKFYEKAIAEDPEMGRAYSGLAVLYYNMGEKAKAEETYEQVMAHIDRMSDREKYRTRGLWYLMQMNYAKAIEEYTTLVDMYPAEEVGLSNLAFAHFVARDMDKALEVGLRSVALSPKSIDSRYNAAWYAIGAGEFAQAEEYALNVIAEWPDYEKTFICLALACIAQGRYEEAADHYATMAGLSDRGASLASTGLADLAMYRGRYDEAAGILVTGIQADMDQAKPERAAVKWSMLADCYLFQDNKASSLQAAQKAMALSDNLSALHRSAEVYAALKDWGRVEDIARNIALGTSSEPQACAKVIRGVSLIRQHRPGEAVPLLQEAQGLLDSWIGRFTLGWANLEAGDYFAAHAEFEACLKRRGEVASVYLDDMPSFYIFPKVYYYLALTQEAMKSPAAKESYEIFLAIKEAGKGGWMAEDARRRLAALQ
jgi:tetratricopeptide (TPR) repeat protein